MPVLGFAAGQPALQAPDQSALDETGVNSRIAVEQRPQRREALRRLSQLSSIPLRARSGATWWRARHRCRPIPGCHDDPPRRGGSMYWLAIQPAPASSPPRNASQTSALPIRALMSPSRAQQRHRNERATGKWRRRGGVRPPDRGNQDRLRRVLQVSQCRILVPISRRLRKLLMHIGKAVQFAPTSEPFGNLIMIGWSRAKRSTSVKQEWRCGVAVDR